MEIIKTRRNNILRSLNIITDEDVLESVFQCLVLCDNLLESHAPYNDILYKDAIHYIEMAEKTINGFIAENKVTKCI